VDVCVESSFHKVSTSISAYLPWLVQPDP
jgi:hypothetical protein